MSVLPGTATPFGGGLPVTPGQPEAEEHDDTEERASEREDENAADAGEHMNPLAREGGVAGDEDPSLPPSARSGLVRPPFAGTTRRSGDRRRHTKP